MLKNIKNKKIAICTLGCKVNQYESDCMAHSLVENGCIITGFDELAEVYIINTCAVTNMAERKSRQMVSRAKKKNEDAIIVVCGCYAQEKGESLKDELGIDIIVGNNKKKNIADILDSYIEEKKITDNLIDINKACEYEEMSMVKPTEHCRAYVKVQDGCNNFCSYCIIPYTRGRIRSRAVKNVINEVKCLAASGIKEVVVTGINLSSYNYEDYDLKKLLLAVADVSGIERVRMGSLEPRIITDDFLSAISKCEKICPHFHLSLQSACNQTLERMNRKYTIEEYEEKCNLIRSYYDMPAITTDVIVGFPKETDEEFDETYRNLERLNLYEMHIFKYSMRKGTVAYDMKPQVSDEKKEERSNALIEMTKRHKEAFERAFKEKKVKVLFEEYIEKDGSYFLRGHTERYILVEKEYDETFCKGHINDMVEVVF